MSAKILAAALMAGCLCAEENPAIGKWSCTNLSDSGTESPWTLLIREEAAKLAGLLTDGEVQLPLSELKLDGSAFSFRFYVNNQPYDFAGTIEGNRLEGKYNGAEASGKLKCSKPEN